VVEEISRVLGVQTIALMLLDDKSATLSIQYCTAKDREPLGDLRVDASAEPFAWIFERRSCAVIPDAASGTGLPFTSKEALCAPLVTDSRNIGMLIAGDKASGKEFRSQEIKLLDALSGEIAATIKKAQLYERIKKLYMNTVEALASAIDAKDPYTYGHSRRVAQISEAICRELGMPGEEIQSIELAALLHDIGKIGTPEHILRKPGRLRPEEMEIIKEHPLQGANILSTIDELQEVKAWIMHHHERYDGRGYPDKSTAEDIPLPARIISIADSYDAMTSDRPYRKGMNPTKVIDIMDDLSGSQFDPDVFKAFKSVFMRKGAQLL
ncbi:MAG TPA: HD domain-containing phosphohydrolase, partial [Geobacteraceae bacterium]